MSAIARRIASAPPLAVLVVAWSVLIVYAYPGQMTQDSFDHLVEARSGLYTDGHPPVIDLLWKLVEYVIAGPFGMLVIQATSLLVGLYAVFRRTFTPRGAAWAAAALFVFPPVMMPMAVIWKDCLMAGFLMLGLAGLLDDRRWVRVLGLLPMFAATAIRYNAFAATFPLVILLFELRPGRHWLPRYAISFAAWLTITFASFGLNARLTDQQMYFWHSSLAVYDIVGTLNYVDRDLSDAELEQLCAGSDLLVHRDIHKTMRDLYSPRDFLPITNDATRTLWSMPIYGTTPAPEPQREAIARLWKEVVTTYPAAYVEHRFAVTAEVLSIGNHRPPGAITRRDFKYPDFAHRLGLGTRWSRVQLKTTHWMSELWRTLPIFVPWIYLVISLVLLPLTRRHRDVFAVLCSGIIMESSLLPLAQSPDYRYSHWMVICACIAVVVLTARRSRAQPLLRAAAITQHSASSQASTQ